MTSRPVGRKRVLLLADANFLAHTSRVLEIGKALQKRGHHVSFAGDGPFVRLAKAENMDTDTVFTVPGQVTLALVRRGGYVDPRWWRKVSERCVDSDVACIRRQKPDVIIGDMRWSARAACEIAQVPYVSVTNAHWTAYSSVRWNAFSDHFLSRYLGRQLGTLLLPSLIQSVRYYWASPYRRLKGKYGLEKSYAELFKVIEGDVTLLCDIPEFGPTRGLPSTFHYTGPLLWEPSERPLPWLETLKPDVPVVYFTLGSSGDQRFFSEIISWFTATPYQVVITTGGQYEPSGPLPSNIVLTDFAPGLSVLKKSAVVINHGGNGTVYQALTAGVPMVGCPSHPDQDMNLQRVEALGTGVLLNPRHRNKKGLFRAVDQVLSHSRYRENATRMADRIRQYSGAQHAATVVEGLLK